MRVETTVTVDPIATVDTIVTVKTIVIMETPGTVETMFDSRENCAYCDRSYHCNIRDYCDS